MNRGQCVDLEHSVTYTRVHDDHTVTLQDHCRDVTIHITQLIYGGELSVDVVTHVDHGPRDEGSVYVRHTRPVYDRGEFPYNL